MNEQVREQLRMLRLPGFLQAMQEQQENNQYADMSFEERLTFLIQKECSRRDNLRLQRRLKNAKLKQSATIDQIDSTVSRGLNKKKFIELAELQWITQHHNLMIVGPTGVGKSFLASALGDKACKYGLSVRYVKTSALISEILDLLDDRFRKSSTLFATQFPVAEWYRLIKDPTLAEAILDRVMHDSFRLELKGESMRKLTSKVNS